MQALRLPSLPPLYETYTFLIRKECTATDVPASRHLAWPPRRLPGLRPPARWPASKCQKCHAEEREQASRPPRLVTGERSERTPRKTRSIRPLGQRSKP